MDGSLDEPPVTIRQSRLKLALRFALWPLLAASLVVLFVHRDDVVLAGFDLGKTATAALYYGSLFLFALAAASIAIVLINPAALRLDPEGFTYSNLWGAKRLNWDDVEKFDVRSRSMWEKEVIYNMSQWYVWLHPHEMFPLGSFGNNWPMRAEELAKRMNDAKAKWGQNRLPRGQALRDVA